MLLKKVVLRSRQPPARDHPDRPVPPCRITRPEAVTGPTVTLLPLPWWPRPLCSYGGRSTRQRRVGESHFRHRYESVSVLRAESGTVFDSAAQMDTGVLQRHDCGQGRPIKGGTAEVAGRGRDEVVVNSGDGSGADTDLDSVVQTAAAARERDLIARLTRRRAASGLSQARLARLMQTSQSAVARLESGRHGAQFSTLTRYAEALGLSLNLVEGVKTRAGSSSEDPGTETAGIRPLEQVSAEQPGHAAPNVSARSKVRPGPDHVLTSRQRKVLNVIKDSVQKRGYPPSMREIGEAVGLASTSSVASQLSALQRKGYLYRDVGRPRAVEVRLPGLQARPEPGREEDEAAGIPDIDIPSQEAGVRAGRRADHSRRADTARPAHERCLPAAQRAGR